MDFIERLFGFSPDGGDGSTELAIVAVFVLIAMVVTWRWVANRTPSSPGP